LDSPAVVIEAATLRNRDIKAVKLSSVVVEGSTSGCNSVKSLVGITLCTLISCLGLAASVIDRPGGKRLNKVGWVRVVNHSHGAKRAVKSADKALNLSSSTGNLTEVKDVTDSLIVGRLVSQVSKLIETSLDHDRALLISLAVVIGGDVVIGVGRDIAIEKQDRGTGSQSTLEHVRVLHAEPG